MRFEFLKEHRGEIGPIRKACGLMKVSKSGFYEYLGRKKSDAQIEREAIEGFVVEAFERHKCRYGYRRIKRNRRWVGDITYIPTREGWLYLAAVIDAFSRKVVGWSMSERITEKVAIDAMAQAVGREGPPDDGSLGFHDDQGAQYTSRSFQRCLDSHGIVQSVSRPGTPLDNAVAESFFKTLKRELVKERSYGTRDEAKQDIFKYIELYYNRVRMHSSLGYMSPVEYERQYA